MLNLVGLNVLSSNSTLTLVLIVRDRAPAITFMFKTANCWVAGRGELILGTTSSLCYKRNSRTLPWVIEWRMGLPTIEV